MDDAKHAQPAQQAQSVPLAQPVNIAQKEQEPINSSEQLGEEELIRPSELEPKIPEEALKAGMEKVSEKIFLPDQVQLAKESTPVSTEPSGIVQIMKDIKAQGGNTKNSSNSIRCLWELVLKLYKRFRLVN